MHHGVYVGNGLVVHYAGLSRSWRRGPVEVISLSEFSPGESLWVRWTPAARHAGPPAVRRALSRLGEDTYRLLTNNCEHFCAWCVEGDSRSLQVERWLARPRATVLAIVARIAQAFGLVLRTGYRGDTMKLDINPPIGHSKLLKLYRLLVALSSTLAFAHGVGAAEEPWYDKAEAISNGIPGEAQKALVCEVVSDWSAFQVTQLIRDDAKESQAVDPQGIEVLRQIRLTEGLASVAFGKLAPEADHDAMYQDAVARMRVYLNEDRKGADTSAKRMVPACQQTYRKMASEGTLTRDQIKTAKDASRESVAKLIEEMQAQGYSVQQ